MENESELLPYALLGLALPMCCLCSGTGQRARRGICGCVRRQIFRECYGKFKRLACGTLRGQRGKKESEYVADFIVIARRELDDAEYQIFRFHFLLGADWKMCCKRLNIERGQFFHAVYRIEQQLGRAFHETRPYGLYRGYFGSATRGEVVKPFPVPEPRYSNGVPLKPPLAEPKPAPPEPMVCVAAPAPQPEPEPAPVIWDEVAIVQKTRELWRTGINSRSIATRLTVMGVPPIAGKWTALTVRKLLRAA